MRGGNDVPRRVVPGVGSPWEQGRGGRPVRVDVKARHPFTPSPDRLFPGSYATTPCLPPRRPTAAQHTQPRPRLYRCQDTRVRVRPCVSGVRTSVQCTELCPVSDVLRPGKP